MRLPDNWLDDKAAQKQEHKRQERIAYYESKIAEEIEAVKDCLDQGYFSIANRKLERILKFRNTILKLNIN